MTARRQRGARLRAPFLFNIDVELRPSRTSRLGVFNTIDMDTVGLEERVQSLVERELKEGPIFLVEFSVRGSKGSHTVNVFVESDEDLNIDDLAGLSHDIGFVLDVEDVMPGRYTLNVSTPDATRPLRLPRQYRKHIGRNLRVHYRKHEDTFTEVCGELLSVQAAFIQIQNGKGTVKILHDDIQWAKVQLPW